MATNYEFLDKTGLDLLVEKLKTYISNADLATLQSANAYTDEKIAIVNAAIEAAQADAEAAQTAADTAQSGVDDILAKIGTVPDGKTIMGIITAIQESSYDDSEVRELIQNNADDIADLQDKDTELAADIKTNADAIAALNGTGTDSVDAKIDAKINEFATNVTNDNVVNSYKELIDWVATHGSEAAEMAAAIEANEKSIDDLEALVGTIPSTASATTIVGLIQELVSAEQTRAEAAESGLNTRVTSLEGKLGESGSVATDISTAKEEAIETATEQAAADATTKANKAESNANSYTDTKISAVQTSVDKNTTDITNLTSRVAANETAVSTTLPASIKEAKDAAGAAQSDVDILEKTVTSNTESITTLTDRVDDLEEASHTHSSITSTYINSLFTN